MTHRISDSKLESLCELTKDSRGTGSKITMSREVIYFIAKEVLELREEVLTLQLCATVDEILEEETRLGLSDSDLELSCEDASDRLAEMGDTVPDFEPTPAPARSRFRVLRRRRPSWMQILDRRPRD